MMAHQSLPTSRLGIYSVYHHVPVLYSCLEVAYMHIPLLRVLDPVLWLSSPLIMPCLWYNKRVPGKKTHVLA